MLPWPSWILHQERYLQLVHRLESWLARHWPELPTLIELTSSSLMALLARIGGPADVAAAPDRGRQLLLGISHRLMPEDKVAAVIASRRQPPSACRWSGSNATP